MNGYNGQHGPYRQPDDDDQFSPFNFLGQLIGFPGQSPGGFPPGQGFGPGGFPGGGPGGFPGGPGGFPGGGPGGFPGGGPGGFPGGLGQGPSGPPQGPPPSFTPQQGGQYGVQAVDPGSIRGCLYRYTYVWLDNRQRFWFYPTYVGRRSVSGYRWTGFFWVYYGVDLRRIDSFQCY
ncbi:hypothetical protein [Piscibacillus salipiscarius]|uniref:Transporter n=1 Tax=Piscibacillus salipiscarius TaxID=299480 RepID=A0ABW5QB61_9BACI|nr:hypothetical protein [Piscibacillus salipiscarius]